MKKNKQTNKQKTPNETTKELINLNQQMLNYF